jgi:Domain of unknown function (DUF4156)/Short C-terminal domain
MPHAQLAVDRSRTRALSRLSMTRWAVMSAGLLSLLSSCLSNLSQPAGAVGIGKEPPYGTQCRELGLVYGSGWGSDWASGEARIESAQNELRNKTAKLGGNFVTMDVVTGGPSVSISGRAMLCAKSAPMTAAATSSASADEATSHPTRGLTAAPQAAMSAVQPPEQRIRGLNELHDKGLITDAEYQQRRQEIIDSL